MNINNTIDLYFKIQKEIHNQLGYCEDWRVIPMDDAREMYWTIVGGEGHGGHVWYASTKEALRIGLVWEGLIEDDEIAKKYTLKEDIERDPWAENNKEETPDFYSNEIYTQRFLPKWVYRTPEVTMICVDTHCDGNQFLQLFDSTKECKFDLNQ